MVNLERFGGFAFESMTIATGLIRELTGYEVDSINRGDVQGDSETMFNFRTLSTSAVASISGCTLQGGTRSSK